MIRGLRALHRVECEPSEFQRVHGSPLDPTAHHRNEFMLFKCELEHHFGEICWCVERIFRAPRSTRSTSTPYPGYDELPGAIVSPTRRAADLPRRSTPGAVAFARWRASSSGIYGSDRCISIFPSYPPPSNTVFTARPQQEYAGYLEQEGSFFDGHVARDGRISRRWQQPVRQGGQPRHGRLRFRLRKFRPRLRGSYTEGFRAPSFDELYFPDFGNPNLKPEISSE